MSDSDDQAAKKKQKIKHDQSAGCSKMSSTRTQLLLYDIKSTHLNQSGDPKAAERSRLYRERNREEINRRRRELRQCQQKIYKMEAESNAQNINKIEQTQATSNNQRSSKSHTQRQQRYYERHKEEINKRKRDSRRKQNISQSVPLTAAERNRNYRERNRQEINERRRHSRRRQQSLQQIRIECSINNIDAIVQIH